MTEHEQARMWRQRLGLSQNQLAELTGYARQSIYWFERGVAPPGKGVGVHPIKPWIWQRYKMACRGVAAQLNDGDWNWG